MELIKMKSKNEYKIGTRIKEDETSYIYEVINCVRIDVLSGHDFGLTLKRLEEEKR